MKKQKLTLNEELSQMKRMMGKLMNEDNNIEDEPYNPIKKVHSEYESPSDRRYNSDDWVQAQRDAEGKKDTLYDEILSVTFDNEICGPTPGVWIEIMKNGDDGSIRLCFDIDNHLWTEDEPQTMEYPGYSGGLEELDYTITKGEILYNNEDFRELTPDEIKILQKDKKIYQKIFKDVEKHPQHYFGDDDYSLDKYIN